jgi:phospholipase/carboxylesterase
MQHVFIKGTNEKTLLLLHGTGGTENDLLGLAKEIDSEASVLSVRGNVLENGMPRFFRRIADGVFDMEDLRFRTNELYDFVNEAAKKYEFDRSNVIAIGYSNGANIAAALMYYKENALYGALLHHPMVPDHEATLPNLSGVNVWIGAGHNDMMCPPEESNKLNAMLTEAGASVHVDWFNYGHQLTMPEVDAAKAWYQNLK